MSTIKSFAGNNIAKMGNLSEESSLTELNMAINTYLLVSVEENTERQVWSEQNVSNLQSNGKIVGSEPKNIQLSFFQWL